MAAEFIFCTVILSTYVTKNREIFEKQEIIEKLSGNYREVRNFRELIEKQ